MEPSVATHLDDPARRLFDSHPTTDRVPYVTFPPARQGTEEPPDPPIPASPLRKGRLKRLLIATVLVVLTPILLSWALVLSLNFWTPPRSSFMLQDGEPLVHQYVELKHISRYAIAATIAHEDQVLGTRSGPFDWEDFKARIDAHMAGKEDPSGSTIPQQLAKNLFLSRDQNAFRKGIEAGFAYELSYSLSPQRMVEMYLNFAEFGPKLYGICAATWYYFKTPPWAMTPEQAAVLMAVVPFPNLIKRGPDGGAYVDKATHPKTWDNLNGAANVWVPRQLEGMGGWQAAVATIGITDTATDHQPERDAFPDDPNSCSTWPKSVVERYEQEGIPLN